MPQQWQAVDGCHSILRSLKISKLNFCDFDDTRKPHVTALNLECESKIYSHINEDENCSYN